MAGKLRLGLLGGARKGLASFIWICRITIPVSFLVMLLQWSGGLRWVDFLLEPLMELINLPPEAALPILSGIFINIYAVIAVITVLPFSLEQMTLIAVFSLIAHNMIAEGIVQMKSGMGIVRTTLIRLAAAVVTVLVLSRLMGVSSESLHTTVILPGQGPFLAVFLDWLGNTIVLLLRVLAIIVLIMVALELSRVMGWLDQAVRLLGSVMRILGLSPRVAPLWLPAVVFGLLYGGAVIVEEARKGCLTREELEDLHVSIGINHAAIEDPALFAALGISALWLWIPRLAAAVLAVYLYRATRRVCLALRHTQPVDR